MTGAGFCEIPEIPGAMAYGKTGNEAVAKTQSLALRILADRIEHGENVPGMDAFFSVAA